MKTETQQTQNAQDTCHTLKEAALSDRFKKAVEWLRKDQKYRLKNGLYGIEGEDFQENNG